MIRVSVTKNLIPQVKASVTGKSEKAVRDNAHYMRDVARSIAPVQTGAFKESIYVHGPGSESDFSLAAVRAMALRPAAEIVPEVQTLNINPQKPEALVSSAVEYAVHLEEGTAFMPPRPTFRQAALATEMPFKNDMTKVAAGW